MSTSVAKFVELRMELFKELGEIKESTDINALKSATENFFIKETDNGFICWLAECDGQIVGSSGLTIFKRPPYEGNLYGLEGYIMNIYTIPQYRKKGIATIIVKEIINYVKKINVKKLWLHSSNNGRYVYEALGFKSNDSEMELFL
jgi:GNAT superfamily N-acetyltransferase